MHIQTIPRSTKAVLFTGIALAVLYPFVLLAPGLRQMLFCFPAAWLSSILLGSPCVPMHAGYMITQASLPVWVSLACSGSRFFVLLVAMGLGLAYRHHRLAYTSAVTIIIMAYAITLVTNTCRITLGLHAAIWARAVLPSSMWAGIHLSVGVLVFLCALVGAYIISEWRLRYDQECK